MIAAVNITLIPCWFSSIFLCYKFTIALILPWRYMLYGQSVCRSQNGWWCESCSIVSTVLSQPSRRSCATGSRPVRAENKTSCDIVRCLNLHAS